MLSREEHKALLRDADERVLPRRKGETDEAYGRRMYEPLNGRALSPHPPAGGGAKP